ncbi:MAG: primosomal protein N' [Nitrospirae bacterium]|nr:primosomal protein N' [Nitrospirota bacterium]MBI3593422.1 primosomal protein N' [Nitrospirota bacterium]
MTFKLILKRNGGCNRNIDLLKFSSMVIQYATIAIARPVEQLFQYEIPSHLLDRVAVGKRVKVPFGRQVIQGFVVSLDSETSVKRIKPILEVSEYSPQISTELISLSVWIATYYFSYPGVTLKMFLPPEGTHAKLRRTYLLKIAPEDLETAMSHLKNAPRQTAVLRRFLKQEGERLIPEEGNANPYRSLAEKNILIEEEREVFRNPYARQTPRYPIPELTPDQKTAFEKIKNALEKNVFSPFLLFGVTGSGKTEIYLRALEHGLKLGKEGLLIVPEISLTPQMIQRVKGRFGDRVGVIHSGLSAGERGDAWKKIESGEISIVVGVRSSVFVPFRKLGIIIIDEEHDPAYKQESDVRYHARDTALVRAKQLGSVVLMGSATPSLESYYNSQNGKSVLLSLDTRVGERTLPFVKLINLKETPPLFKEGGITEPLHQAILSRLERKEQVLLFLNRRGFSPFLLCYECGFSLKCKNCSVSMTFHKKSGQFHCHYCDYSVLPLSGCPLCHGIDLAYMGQGTEKIEEELRSLYPEARIRRMDRDTTGRKFSHDQIIQDMQGEKVDILIGTQMVTKGHDLPKITLVGVLCADTILNFPDFRSAEKTFQTLTQVAGRAGRGDTAGEVLIQTYNPDHYSLVFARNQDYKGFYQKEMAFRRELNYPPYSRLVTFLFSGSVEKKVEEKTGEFVKIVERLRDASLEILGPAPAPLMKLKGKYRWRCLIKGRKASKIQETSREILKRWQELKKDGVKLEIDVDPQNLL